MGRWRSVADSIRRIDCNWKYVKYMRVTDGALAMSQSEADVLWPYVSELEWPDIAHVLDIVRLPPESREGIDSYIEMRTAGVPHTYIADFSTLYIALGPEWGVETIITLHKAGVPSHYASVLLSSFDTADAVSRLYVAGVPLDYALDCSIAGLQVDRVLAAHNGGLPLEYATA